MGVHEYSYRDFSDPEVDAIQEEFLPYDGEGENFSSQAVTAVSKLIYKWFNDGDVYDNNYYLEGFVNDLSSYANWLYKYVPEVRDILERIYTAQDENSYSAILYNLLESILSWDFVNEHKDEDCIGSIYDCEGPFSFRIYDEEDDDE